MNKNSAGYSISRREKQVSFFSGFFNARKGRQGRGALIRTAVAILVVCAILLSQFSYSLIQATGVGDIPTEVYAENSITTVQNLSLGSSVLTPAMTRVKEISDLDEKERVTSAQTVYYGNHNDQPVAWYVVGYNGTGAVQMEGTATMLLKDKFDDTKYVWSTSQPSYYSQSYVKPKVEGYYSSLFSEYEKKGIEERTLIQQEGYITSDQVTDGIYDNVSTQNAKLWLLSTKEADLVGQTYRRWTPLSPSPYWLRTRGEAEFYVGYTWVAQEEVYYNGKVYCTGTTANNARFIRPAFNLNMSSILLVSNASDNLGKPSGDIGTLSAVETNSSNEWKLTLLDDGTESSVGDGHKHFTASLVGSNSVLIGGNVKIKYSGAQTGDNEYVSVFLKDSSDNIVYYGHLASQTASADAASLTIPSDITPGTYTVGVFAEQCNGDEKTDYGSAISTFDINVVTHSHDFTYSSGIGDGANTITATCINEESDCSLDDRKVNLTIVKPARTVFGGSGSEKATLTGLEGFNSATGKSVSAFDIKYVGRDGTSYDASTTAPKDAGKYRASITVENVTAYVDYEISKAAGSISYDSGSENKTYGDAAFTNTLRHTGDGNVTYSSSDTSVATVDRSTGEVSIVGVGDTDITATVEDGKNYTYSVKEASYKLTVNRADMEVDVTGYDGACDGQSHSISVNVTKPTEGYTITYGLEEGAYSLTENPAVSTVSDSKRVYFKITAPYYNDYTSSAEIKLTKGNQVISADDVNVSYGGTGSVSAESNGDGTISYDVKSGSEDYIAVDSTTGKLTIKKVPVDGKACVTVTAGETDDYNEATKDVNIKISKATIKITANDYNISVGDQIPELTSTECYYVTGLVGDDALTTTPTLKYQQSGSNKELSGTATALNLGTYDIVPTGADAGGNYAIDYVKGKLTINKATPTVTAPVPKELTFNGGDQELVTGGTTSGGEMQYAIGSESGPTGSWSTDIPEETDAGTYYVWYKVVGGSDYSDIEAAPVEVVISPKSIANATVTLNETKYLYDGESHDVAVSSVVLDGISLTKDTDFSVSGTLSGIDKGTYTVTVTALDDSNYTGETTADWSIGMETPVITPPTSTPITYGQTLGESALNGGKASVGDTSVDGKFTWKASSLTPEVSDSNTTEYEVIFTPDNMESYTTASCFVTVTVNKAASPSDNPAPTPKKELTDNGHSQELVNTVPVTGGTIEYVIGTDDKTPPTSGWGSDIPTASKPGTYYIWYKVVGDENHFDSDPKYIVVTIEKPVYSNYEGDGGKWTKGSTDGLKFTFKRSAEDVTTIEHFAGILVDGKEVAESNYDAVSGSVVITLKAPYLETLSAGEHILTAKFNDGDSADAGFTIIEVPAADDNNDSKAGDDSKSGGTADSNESKKTDVKNPDKSDKTSEKTTSTVGASKNHKTGDEVPIGLIMIIGLASLVGAVWSLVLKKNLKPTKK